jgi:hypothetical protein
MLSTRCGGAVGRSTPEDISTPQRLSQGIMSRVTAFSLPENLVDSVLADGSPQREAWLATLPNMVAEYAERWSLDVGSPYQPGGRCAWVAPVRDLTGRNLVLKVAWSNDEAIHEADGLRAWAGNGTVLLHDHAGGEATDVLLLERCHPGTPLGQARLEPDQDLIVAGLLHRLWQAPVGGRGFRPLQEMCDAWAVEFEQRVNDAPGALDPGLARTGSSCSGLFPPPGIARCCCAPTCMPGTFSPPNANRGWSSTPSPTSATRPTTRYSTCSTATNRQGR